ncbi:hypothetical protein CANCADRAFT_138899 [Tortispora caseinolytica NRRL Y-17796]|uniref:Uncharacterized protein n=1 Tax=Tortispora caseinolytica NRRL Y-17796 TaxID=767744 RepID=A0A1E4TC77_9ASCO|nr:hypothetical protein CANCADRAFT_138899 [Tortispora caseinolytica NRRL Y-17796]
MILRPVANLRPGAFLLRHNRPLWHSSRLFNVRLQSTSHQPKEPIDENVHLRARLSPVKEDAKGNFSEVMRLLKLARPELWPLLGCSGLLALSSAVSMTVPFSVGRVLDIASGANESGTIFGLTVNQFYGGLIGVFVVSATASYFRTVFLRIIGERLITRLRSKLFKKAITADAEFYDANRVGDLISRIGVGTSIVSRAITSNLADGLRAIVSGSVGFAMMIYTSPQLTMYMMLIIPPVAAAAGLYGRRLRAIARKTQTLIGNLTKVTEERLSNVRTTQAYSSESKELHAYNSSVRDIFNLSKKEAHLSGGFYGFTNFSGNITFLSLLVIGSNFVSTGAISIGELTSFLMYAVYSASSMIGLTSFFSELMKGAGTATRLFELLDYQPAIHETKGIHIPPAHRGSVTFDNVRFAYPTRPSNNIFNGLSFSIQPGSNVCIVGPSGSGKSTVASLILRFYDPVSGSVLFDGMDIRNFNLRNYRRAIGFVSQEPVLTDDTIAANIALGKPHAKRWEIEAAAERANCGFVKNFPNGLDTQVGVRGSTLSGGQRQRVAIARALIRNPSILLMDEATSALDTESENAVNDAMSKLMTSHSTTIIAIAHRASTIRRADRIIVLSTQGTIAEDGTYAELMAKNGVFKQLMSSPTAPSSASPQ